MKEIIKNNLIYGVGLLAVLYLIVWLEPNLFIGIPLITPLIITLVFVCCACSFDFVYSVWKETQKKGDKQELKRLCSMVDCLVEGKAVSLRVYKAMFTDEDLKDKVDFICWYLEDNHVNFRIKEVEDKKFGKGFEFTVLEKY